VNSAWGKWGGRSRPGCRGKGISCKRSSEKGLGSGGCEYLGGPLANRRGKQARCRKKKSGGKKGGSNKSIPVKIRALYSEGLVRRLATSEGTSRERMVIKRGKTGQQRNLSKCRGVGRKKRGHGGGPKKGSLRTEKKKPRMNSGKSEKRKSDHWR